MDSSKPTQRPPTRPNGGPVRFFLRYFLRGLLFVVPVAVTFWLLVYAFTWIDGLVNIPEEGSWKIPLLGIEFSGQDLAWKGSGFFIIIAAITGIGILTSNVLSGWILRRIDQLFTHVPVVEQIYSAVKDMVEAFVSEDKKFDKPVLLSFAAIPDVEVIGFVTREDLEEFGRPGKVAVYVPQSYNFAANLILVPKERVTPIDVAAGDVMAFVVSGGVSQASKRDEEIKS